MKQRLGLSRRAFLAGVAISSGMAAAAGLRPIRQAAGVTGTTPTPGAYLPLIEVGEPRPDPSPTGSATPSPTSSPTPSTTPSPTPSITPSATATSSPTSSPTATATPTSTPSPTSPPVLARVVQVHGSSAVTWTGQTAYWDYVNQDVVNQMVNRGVMELTGADTLADAWRRLLPSYRSGEKIAIKVNFNNSYTGSCADQALIEALAQPVNAIVLGLEQMGVARENVSVYDAVMGSPAHFAAQLLPGIRQFGKYCSALATFSDTPDHLVIFNNPAVPMPKQIVTDVLMAARYLINVPILKGNHYFAGVTLGFKNHFGSINNCRDLHPYIDVVNQPAGYSSQYNPLVDLLRSPLIGGKTVLTVGDGLVAGKWFDGIPVAWATFGGQVPKSLFFSRDPVAVDCVMHDYLAAEPDAGVVSGANNYLKLAAQANLGVFEQRNPWTDSYHNIALQRMEV